MKRVYKAILHGDRVEWLDGAPDTDRADSGLCLGFGNKQIRRPGARRENR